MQGLIFAYKCVIPVELMRPWVKGVPIHHHEAQTVSYLIHTTSLYECITLFVPRLLAQWQTFNLLMVGSTVSWTPPDPPNNIFYNIRITRVDSEGLKQIIEVFTDTSMDISEYVDSNGDFLISVQVQACRCVYIWSN